MRTPTHLIRLLALALFAALVISGCADDTGSSSNGDTISDTDQADMTGGDTTMDGSGDSEEDGDDDTTESCIDPDDDGYGEGVCVLQGEDCAPNDPAINPGAAELCNGVDDNCNDEVDEGFDVMTDPQNCGMCGNVCSDNPNSMATCDMGSCIVEACDTDYYDIDGDPANGCEYQCTPQVPGAEVCDGEDNNCDGEIDEGFDLMTDLDNCGACGTVCNITTGASAMACNMGSCEVSTCEMGLDDCDGDYSNGCEADLNTLENCGSCGNSCDYGPNTVATCGANGCEFGGCMMGFDDCNQDMSDGCEVDLSTGTTCVCTPNDTRPCYTGDPATIGVGPCQQGVETCAASGTNWGFVCAGETTPVTEICGNGVNDDCAGGVDDGLDEDGDGWATCSGDCCDNVAQGCTDPEKVNPGAYDYVDPTGMAQPYDDDCDGTADNPPPTTCSSNVSITSVTGTDLANAMDICKTTTAMSGDWGLISAELLRADGTGTPQNVQLGVLNSFGSNVSPRANATIAVLSSGTARDQDGDGDDTGYIFPDGAGHEDSTNEVLAPSDYLAANGGQLQTAPGCPNGDTTVNDSVQLRLRIRVPTNAEGIRFNLKFYSAEYPEWVCTSFNDFFLAMLYTGAPGIPADYNISFDSQNNPISVNNAFFDVCQGCPSGTAELVNTGYPETDAGGTDWLATTAPVVPGEIIELQFHIWDTGDHAWDSLVVLDNFEWQLNPTSVGTIED